MTIIKAKQEKKQLYLHFLFQYIGIFRLEKLAYNRIIQLDSVLFEESSCFLVFVEKN